MAPNPNSTEIFVQCTRWLGGRVVVRTLDSRFAVEGSPPGHDIAWLFILVVMCESHSTRQTPSSLECDLVSYRWQCRSSWQSRPRRDTTSDKCKAENRNTSRLHDVRGLVLRGWSCSCRQWRPRGTPVHAALTVKLCHTTKQASAVRQRGMTTGARNVEGNERSLERIHRTPAENAIGYHRL